MKKLFTALLLILRLLNVHAQEKPLKEFQRAGHNIICLAFTQDCRYVATGGMDNLITLWDVASGAELLSLSGHTNWVESIAISPDGNYLISGSRDKTARIWNLRNGEQTAVLKGHNGSVAAVTYSYDGKVIATGSKDGKVRVFDAYSGILLRTLDGHKGEVTAISISHDDRHLASTGSDKQLIVFDLADGSVVRATFAHDQSVRAVNYSPDGKYLATASDDKLIKIWNASDGSLNKMIKGHSHWVQSLHFSPDGKYLASGGHDKAAWVWDVESSMEVFTIKKQNEVVYDVEFSADGKYLATSDLSVKIKIWDIGRLKVMPRNIVPSTHSVKINRGGDPGLKSFPMVDLDPSARGKNYVLLIGIDKYAYLEQGKTAVKDAKDVKNILLTKYDYVADNILELYDQQATVEAITEALNGIKARIQPKDNLLIYFSGQAYDHPQTKEGYWMPVNAHVGKEDEYLSNSLIQKSLSSMDSRHVFLVSDAYLSSALFGPTNNTSKENAESLKSRWGLTSGRLQFEASPSQDANSKFCSYFLGFLQNNTKKKFNCSDLVQYVKSSMATTSTYGGQLNGVGDEGGEYVFYLK